MNIAIYHQYSRNEIIERFVDNMLDAELEFMASDLMKLGLRDMSEVEDAVIRAIRICQGAGMPVRNNFKAVYSTLGGQIISDWILSPFARKLVIVNADANNPLVARVQVQLLSSADSVWNTDMHE